MAHKKYKLEMLKIIIAFVVLGIFVRGRQSPVMLSPWVKLRIKLPPTHSHSESMYVCMEQIGAFLAVLIIIVQVSGNVDGIFYLFSNFFSSVCGKSSENGKVVNCISCSTNVNLNCLSRTVVKYRFKERSLMVLPP